jgi:sugar phosphate isomerase/epimerase
MTWPLGLFTACAPWEPLPALADRAAAAGLAGLDLACKRHRFDPARPVGFWDNNAAVLDLEAIDDLAPAARETLDRRGLRCRVLCGYSVPGDLATARRLAAGARTLRAPMVRLMAPGPELGRVAAQLAYERSVWRELAAVGAAEGVRFVVELHEGTVTPSASAALRILEGLDPGHVGVILDVANLVREGNEPLPWVVEALGAYLAHVHVKDVALRSDEPGWCAAATSFVPLGRGVLRWPVCLGILRRAGYGGWLAIENFTGLERGPERITADAAWLRAQVVESDHV